MSASTPTPTESTASAMPTPRARRRTRIALAALAAAVVVLTPFAVNGFFSGALADADSSLQSIPAALVNEDEMTTTTNADGTETVNFAGRGLVTELTGAENSGFDWTLTNADDAAEGLENGTYYAVLTVPSDFSASLNTLATSDPQAGAIDITTDAAHGYLAGLIASTVASEVQSTFGQTVTTQVVNGLYTSFGTVGESLGEAAGGATQLASGADGLASGATQLADGATQLTGGLNEYASGVGTYTDGVSQLAGGVQQLADGAAQANTGLTDGINRYTGGVSALASGYQQLLAGVAQDPTLSPATLAALQGFGTQLNTAAAGGAELSAQTSAALGGLASGAADAASGANQLASNGPALVSGAGEIATGAQGLADGATQLGSGATQLGDGARTLAAGLQKGADQFSANAPTDDGGQTAAEVIAQPVTVDVTTLNATDDVGQIVAIILVPAALWIGALALFLRRRPFSAATLASSASTARLTVRAFGRAAVFAAAQTVLLVGFLHLALGVAWSSLPATFGFSLLVALAFTAFHQLLTTAFGRIGAVVSLLLLALQLASTGGLYPVEILSGPFQAINAVSPLAYAVAGMQSIITGGAASIVVTGALVMAALLLLSLLLAGAALARRRRPLALGWLVPERRSRLAAPAAASRASMPPRPATGAV